MMATQFYVASMVRQRHGAVRAGHLVPAVPAKKKRRVRSSVEKKDDLLASVESGLHLFCEILRENRGFAARVSDRQILDLYAGQLCACCSFGKAQQGVSLLFRLIKAFDAR